MTNKIYSKHFHGALMVTELHKRTMIGEHARAHFKLSEALQLCDGSEDDSRRAKEEAKRLLKIRSPDVVDTEAEKLYDDLVYILWR